MQLIANQVELVSALQSSLQHRQLHFRRLCLRLKRIFDKFYLLARKILRLWLFNCVHQTLLRHVVRLALVGHRPLLLLELQVCVIALVALRKTERRAFYALKKL